MGLRFHSSPLGLRLHSTPFRPPPPRCPHRIACFALTAPTPPPSPHSLLRIDHPHHAALTTYPPHAPQVRPHHSKLIFDEFAGDKNMVTFDGDHNDLRPDFFMDSACIFLKSVLMIPDSAQLEVRAHA